MINNILKAIKKNLAATNLGAKIKPHHQNNKPQVGGNTANMEVKEAESDGEDPTLLVNEVIKTVKRTKENAIPTFQVDISALPVLTEDNIPNFSEMERTTTKDKTCVICGKQ